MVATLTFLPFKLSGSITALTALDFLGLGLPPGSPSLGELLRRARPTCRRPGSASPAFFSIADAAQPADLHRRGACATRSTRARRSGEGSDGSHAARSSTSATCRSPSAPAATVIDAVKGVSFTHRQGRDGGAGRRIRLGQDRLGAVDPAAAALSGRLASDRRDLLRGQGPAEADAGGDARHPRQARSRSSSRSR